MPAGAHDPGSRPGQHRGRREHRPGGPGPAPERDVHDPRSRGRRRPGPSSSASRRELDAAGSAARLPLLPRVRPAGLARHAQPGPGHAGPRAARDRAQRGPGRRHAHSPWAFQRWLLDAGPADQVFTLTPEQYSPVLTSNGADLVRLRRRRRHDDPLRRRHLRRVPAARHRLHACSTAWAAARPATSRPTRSSTSRPARRRRSIISRLHQPVSGHRRRGRRDHRAGARPGAAEVRRRAASRRAGRGLRGGGAVASVGPAGRHDLPLDRQLAHRPHERRSRRDRASRRSRSSSR